MQQLPVQMLQSEVTSGLVDPRTVHRISDPTDIVSLAKKAKKSDKFVKCIATSKFIVIAEQMQHLQDRVRVYLRLHCLIHNIYLTKLKTGVRGSCEWTITLASQRHSDKLDF